MWLLSDNCLFPALQLVLFSCLAWAVLWDAPTLPDRTKPDGSSMRASADQHRGQLSMGVLGATAGFAATVVSLINNTALKEEMWLKDYSVLFNVIDIGVILYLCFVSRTAREWIFHAFERARID
jgi:hypothetical protein